MNQSENLSDLLIDLLDTSEPEHFIELIQELVKFPEHNSPTATSKTINKYIISPLDHFLEEEYKAGKWVEGHHGWGKVNMKTGEFDEPGPWIERRWVGRWTTATEAATNFRDAAQEIAYRCLYSWPGNPDIWEIHINILEKHWKEFQIHMGCGYVSRMTKLKKSNSKGAGKTNKTRAERAKPIREKSRKLALELLQLNPVVTNQSDFARRIIRRLNKDEKKSVKQIINYVKDLLPIK